MKTLVFHSTLFALVGLVLSPLTVVHASSSQDSPHPVATLEGHTDWVRSVSFSPDGATLASGSSDNTIRLWDVSSGQLKITLEGHTDWARSVSFSPDGTTLASGSSDNTVRLWDVSSGQLKTTLEGHTGWINSVSFSPDGTTIASGSKDNTIRLWDVSSGQLKATLEGHTDWAYSVSFSPDGTTIASGSGDETVRLWDVSSGQLKTTLEGHTGWINSVSFSPDGTTIASGSDDGTVRLWDVSSGQLKVTFEAYADWVWSVSFLPNGTLLASGSKDDTIRLWDVSSGQLKATFEGHTDDVYSVSFSPDGTTLASGSLDGTVKLWDTSEWVPSRPQRLVKISGDNQQGPVGEQLVEPFVVSVLDTHGAPFVGAVVTFAVTTGGGTISVTTTTDADGRAAIRLTLGSDPGPNTAEATVEGLESVTFTAIGYAVPHSLTKVSGDEQQGPAGTQLAAPFVVSVLDADGEPIAGTIVTFAVTTGGGTLLATTVTTDADGRAAIRLTLGSDPGPNTVEATVEGLESVTFTTVGYAVPHSLTKVSGDEQQGLANAQLAEPFVVLVLDADGEPFVRAVVTFAVTTGGGTLLATTVTTDADGRVAITLTLGSDPGPNTVEATVEGLEPVTFTAVVRIPHSLTKVSGDEQQGLANAQLAEPFVVLVLDVDGEPFVGAVVTFAITAGGGTLSATTVTTDADGRVAITLTLGSAPGPNTVEATVEGLEPVTFTAVVQIPYGLTKVSGDEQQGPAGTQLAEPFVVSVLDADGEPFVGAVVTFAVTTGGETLSVTTTTDADGRAAITLTLGSAPGPNTVEATVEGLESVTFTAVGYAVPHSLEKVSGDGQESPAGEQLAEPFVISVLDADGEPIAGTIITFSVTTGGGTLSDTTATTDADGRAATTLTLGSDPGTNTVEATVEGLEPVTFTATGQESPLASLFDIFGGGKLVALPDRPQLVQNAPNPFNSQTVLSYFLLEPGPARLEVFALTGQRVAVLHQGPQQAGYHRLHWGGRDDAGHPLASGTYLYRLVTDATVLTRKLTLLK